MALHRSVVVQPKGFEQDGAAFVFKARFRTFEIPPVRDAIVIGKEAPVHLDNVLATLKLVSTEVFIGSPLIDDVVASIIVRESLLKKVPPGVIEKFVLQRVKPFMSAFEVLRLDLELEILLEANV